MTNSIQLFRMRYRIPVRAEEFQAMDVYGLRD